MHAILNRQPGMERETIRDGAPSNRKSGNENWMEDEGPSRNAARVAFTNYARMKRNGDGKLESFLKLESCLIR